MPNESTSCPKCPVPYWLEGIMDLPLLQQCAQRILLVADGALNYDPESGRGLSLFVTELAKLTPPPVISKAHRLDESTADPDKREFKFNNLDYDQIWLFGMEAAPVLSDPEFKVLTDFMLAGGGLFATGDHENLGYAMGGELLRVRKMRDWSGIPVDTAERIDTVTNPGPDRLAQFHDQSDEFPQRIFPHYSCDGTKWSPHKLLRSPAGDIDVMPDHPHESVCLNGYALHARYQVHGLNLEEFPRDNNVPLAPEIIATSVSAGRFLTDFKKPPTIPRCFGSISVWDGHKVNQGRIVCDSTWHHFININLNGRGAPPDRQGLRDPDFQQVAQYYRNIAEWIAPADCQMYLRLIDLIVERYRFPLVEEWRPLPPHPCPWEPRVRLGALVEAALEVNRGRGFAAEIATAVFEAAGFEEFAELVRPVRAEDAARADSLRQLVSAEQLRLGVLGSVFDAVARHLPANPSGLPKALKGVKPEDTLLVDAVTHVVGDAVDAASNYYAKSVGRTLALIERTTAIRARQVTSEAKTLKQDVSKAKRPKRVASKTKRSK